MSTSVNPEDNRGRPTDGEPRVPGRQHDPSDTGRDDVRDTEPDTVRQDEGARAVRREDVGRRHDRDVRDAVRDDDDVRDTQRRDGVDDVDARRELHAREKERFGGMKFGTGFFGWLAATGALILLVGVAAAIAALIGAVSGGAEAAVNRVASMSTGDLQSAGIWSAIVLLVIWFIAYFIGGYVAGRMARFNGARQGVAVWLWALIIAVVLAIVGAIVGQNVGANISGLPSLPLSPGQATTASIVSGIVVLLVALIGAVLGGLTGMRYHRRIDRSALEA